MIDKCRYTPDVQSDEEFQMGQGCRLIEYSLAQGVVANYKGWDFDTALTAQIQYFWWRERGTYSSIYVGFGPTAYLLASGPGLLLTEREFFSRYISLLPKVGERQELGLRMYHSAIVLKPKEQPITIFVPEIIEEDLRAFGDCVKWHPWIKAP